MHRFAWKRRVNEPFDRCRSLPIVLLSVVLLANTCSRAQDINTNTVAPPTAPVTKTTETPPPVRELICPVGDEVVGLARFFSIPCEDHGECSFLGTDRRCCKGLCRKGVPAPPREPKHEAVLGVPRMCPKEPVSETLPVTKCKTDQDCEGGRRVCCPDKKDQQLYCRTAAPAWSKIPFQRTHAPLMSLIAFMQCQPPPPAVLDVFPDPCDGTIDCFPNLCCQEGAGKFCRPPKQSLVALVAKAAQRLRRG